MSIKERLLELIEKEGLNPNQFYIKTGLANGFINTIGTTLRKPSVEKIERTFPELNIDWLLTGNGEMMKKNNSPHIEFTMDIYGRMKMITKYLIGKGIAENQEKIGELLGYNNKASFSHILNGRKPLPSNFIDRISALDKKVNKVWIETGEGEMLNKDIINPKSDDAPIGENSASTYNIHPDLKLNYTIKNFFKDYYSYLDYTILDTKYLDKQLLELSIKDKELIAAKMGLNFEDFSNGVDIVSKSPNRGKLVPIYDAKASAGTSQVDLTGSKNGWVNIGDLLKDSEGALYVYGNSMIPGYPPGSLLGIRSLNESFIEPGSVYVVETESNRYVKRLYYNEDKTSLLCISDNHFKHTDGPLEGTYFYPPFEIPFSSVKCIFKVTGVIKRNSTSMF